MYKLWSFVRHNAARSRLDAYRAARDGYHNSFGRRLRNIRGYVLNVRSYAGLGQRIGPLAARLTRGEPPDFDALWGGSSLPASTRAAARSSMGSKKSSSPACSIAIVDETIAVLPNREPTPDHYRR